jgi:hypothetical protein
MKRLWPDDSGRRQLSSCQATTPALTIRAAAAGECCVRRLKWGPILVLLLPPTYESVEGPLVFLAGPIQGAPNWQSDAIAWFAANAPTLAIASPRREFAPRDFDYAAQVDWESHHLRRAARCGVIQFWLAREAVAVPGRSYAQTTRFELAEWKVRHERDGIRLVVGIEDGFSGARYVRHRFGQDCPTVPLVSSLVEACRLAAELSHAEPSITVARPGE